MKYTKIEPLHDNVVIKKFENEEQLQGNIIVPDLGREKAMVGTVIAIGPGRRNVMNGELIPMSVEVGDIVNFPSFGGQVSYIEDEEFLIYKDENIFSKLK